MNEYAWELWRHRACTYNQRSEMEQCCNWYLRKCALCWGSINRVYRWGSRVCNSVCKSIRYHHIGGVPPTLPHATTIYFTARKNSTMMCYCAGFEFNSNILTVATALTIPNTTWALLNKEQCHTLAHLMLQRSLWFHTLSWIPTEMSMDNLETL